jgi:hypothetical protein
MHKSILTFGLLASSLVMLPVMPLFNNNAAIPQHGYIISLLPICILFLFTKSLLTSRTYFAGNLE